MESLHNQRSVIGPRTNEILQFCQSRESRLGLNQNVPKSQKTGTSFCTPGFLPSDDAIRNFQPSENYAPNQLVQQSCSQTQNSRHKNLAPWLAKTARSRKKETFSGTAQVLPFPRQQNVPLFLWRATMIHSFPQKSKTKTTPPQSPHSPHHPIPRATAASEELPPPPSLAPTFLSHRPTVHEQ